MSPFSAAGRERTAAGVLVALAMVFVGVAVLQRVHRGDADVLLPLALLAADLTIAAALLSGWYPVRPVAQGLAIFGALSHVLLVMGGRPELIRISSGLLAVTHVYSLVLLFQLGGGYDEDDDEDELIAAVPSAPSVPGRDAAAGSKPTAVEPEHGMTAVPVVEQGPEAPREPEVAGEQASGPEREPEAGPEPEVEPKPEAGPEPEPGAGPEPVVEPDPVEPVPVSSETETVDAEPLASDEPESPADSDVAGSSTEAEPSEPGPVEAQPSTTAPDRDGANEAESSLVEQHKTESDIGQGKPAPVTTNADAEKAPISEERAR